METPKIGLCVGDVFKAPLTEVIPAAAEIGFDAVSPVWSAGGTLAKTVQHARNCGLFVQSLHGPQKNSPALWRQDPDAAGEALAEFIHSLRDCAALGIPIAVFHCVSRFDFSGYCVKTGLRNFSLLAEEADRLGVQIAFENIQGEHYLRALMNHFKDAPHVGFCWDSGHTRCYSPGSSLLTDFGSRLILTHINSNLGITDAGGVISARDDLHYLPFDGITDWEEPMKQLRSARRQEILNFEVKQLSKDYQPQNSVYAQMSFAEYLREAYRQARTFAGLYATGSPGLPRL